jgi:carboxylesterase type B
MSIKTIHHHVPSLKAKIIGELDDAAGLALFRGIPYASVTKRWTQSRTRHFLDSAFDATDFGPRCVQGDGPVMVSGGANDATPGDDEFKCLNLNITVPSEVLLDPGNRKTIGLLPVMFWIHGYVGFVNTFIKVVVSMYIA